VLLVAPRERQRGEGGGRGVSRGEARGARQMGVGSDRFRGGGGGGGGGQQGCLCPGQAPGTRP